MLQINLIEGKQKLELKIITTRLSTLEGTTMLPRCHHIGAF